MYVIRSLFQFAFFWVLPLSPLLTMKLFSEEKRTGTLEMLMTAPVTSVQVVIGKFIAAQIFYMLVWSTLLLFVLVLQVLGKPDGPDWGPVLSMYFGLFFLGTLTNSLGVLASSFSRNQLVAAILALTGNLLFFAVALGTWIFVDNPDVLRLFQFASFQSHFSNDYIRGVIQLRYLVFYLSFMSLFLFLAVSVVESRKWR
jgi:ABC-2 type transport system permease protein